MRRPAYLLFASSWVSSGCLLPVLGHFSRDGHVREAPDFVFIKFPLGGGSGRPPGCPRPRRPRGWGGGGGSKNSSWSPAEEPGGRRLAKGEDPRGGEGEGEGQERTAAPVLLSPPPRPPLHIGVPAPRPGVVAELEAPTHTLRGEMLRPRAGGRGSGEVGDLAGSSRRRPRSRLQHVSLRLGPPPYTLGVPRHAPRDQTEAPAPSQRPLTAEQLATPGPR